MRSLKKPEEVPLLFWVEPPQAAAFRSLDRSPLFIEDEWGRRLNWTAAIGLVVTVISYIKPWEWERTGVNKWAFTVAVAAVIIMGVQAFSRSRLSWLKIKPEWIKSASTPKNGQPVSILPSGIKVAGKKIQWPHIRQYRLTKHPDEETLSVIELRLDPSSGSVRMFVGYDPISVDESQLRRVLHDLHPLAHWDNVGMF